MKEYVIHPVASIPHLIRKGEAPWFAINSFLHDWWLYARDKRRNLIETPPTRESDTLEERQWSAFCAATVEELCQRTTFPIPSWVYDPEYVLDDPWFVNMEPSEWLRKTSPEAFAKRNIFAGSTVLDNKYEIQPPTKRWQPWAHEDLQRFQ